MIITKAAIITFTMVCGIWDADNGKCVMQTCILQAFDTEKKIKLEEYPVQTRICKSISVPLLIEGKEKHFYH